MWTLSGLNPLSLFGQSVNNTRKSVHVVHEWPLMSIIKNCPVAYIHKFARTKCLLAYVHY